jgi:dihydrofolate synthase/folylpolyglutamate synthase
VLGCVRDKDVNNMLQKLPKTAKYVFSQAHSPRALMSTELQVLAHKYQLSGHSIPNVNEALGFARSQAESSDLIVVCGSTYFVAELNEL